jgi:hypothetical protein
LTEWATASFNASIVLKVALNFASGIAAGWAFFLLWRRILPRDRSRVFLQAVPVHASGMLHSEDPDDVMRHYGALMKHVASFATRNTLAVAVGLVPVVALFLLTGALYPQERRASMVEVRPAIAVRGLPASVPVAKTRDGGLLVDRQKVGGGLLLFGETLDRDALATKHVFCDGWLSCLGYELMLFETHRLQESPLAPDSGSVVVRPRVFAVNSFWPYLDDLELAYFVGIMAGGIAAGWRSSVTRNSPA